jgi:hypothetical protein
MANQNTTKGAGRITHGKIPNAPISCAVGSDCRKIVLSMKSAKKAINGKIKPFENIADGAGGENDGKL